MSAKAAYYVGRTNSVAFLENVMAQPETMSIEAVGMGNDAALLMDSNGEPIFTDEQIAYFREKWNEAKMKGGPYSSAEEVFDRLKARYQAMIDEGQK